MHIYTLDFAQAIRSYEGQPLSRQVLLELLKDYKRPFDKISELVRKKELIPVKRGIFVAGPALHLSQPEPYLLANHLTGPSYVSMETALSHWGLIPDQVFEISSMTTGRLTVYNTAVGRFSYTHLPLPYYSFGQQQLKIKENQVALVANPEKALCDKVIATSELLFRSTAQLKLWLTEDMRMDRERLRNLNTRIVKSWLDKSPKRNTIQLLIRALENL